MSTTMIGDALGVVMDRSTSAEIQIPEVTFARIPEDFDERTDIPDGPYRLVGHMTKIDRKRRCGGLLKLSDKDMAQALNVSVNTIWRWLQHLKAARVIAILGRTSSRIIRLLFRFCRSASPIQEGSQLPPSVESAPPIGENHSPHGRGKLPPSARGPLIGEREREFKAPSASAGLGAEPPPPTAGEKTGNPPAPASAPPDVPAADLAERWKSLPESERSAIEATVRSREGDNLPASVLLMRCWVELADPSPTVVKWELETVPPNQVQPATKEKLSGPPLTKADILFGKELADASRLAKRNPSRCIGAAVAAISLKRHRLASEAWERGEDLPDGPASEKARPTHTVQVNVGRARSDPFPNP